MPKGIKLPYTGILLIIVGLFWLLSNMDLFSSDIFMLAVGALFIIFYIISGSRLGYLIPGLIILALAGTNMLPRYLVLPDFLAGTLFFYMLGTAFILLFVIHTRKYREEESRHWPLYPGFALYGFGLFIYLLEQDYLPLEHLQRTELILPAILIGLGIYFVIAQVIRKSR